MQKLSQNGYGTPVLKPGAAEAMSLVNYVSGCFATYPCATVFIRAHGRKATVYVGERDDIQYPRDSRPRLVKMQI